MNSTNTQIGCSNFAPSVFNAWCLIQYRTNQFNGVTSYFLSVCMRIAMQFMDQRQPTSNFNNTNNICVQRTQNGEMWYKLNEIEVPIWIECDISLGHFVNPFGVAHTSVQIFMHLFFSFSVRVFLTHEKYESLYIWWIFGLMYVWLLYEIWNRCIQVEN